MTSKELKDLIRNPYAWPSGYTQILLMMDGEYLCVDCVKENFRNILDSLKHNTPDGWNPAAADINWEEDNIFCVHCYKHLVPEWAE